jgi:hypothetical protein
VLPSFVRHLSDIGPTARSIISSLVEWVTCEGEREEERERERETPSFITRWRGKDFPHLIARAEAPEQATEELRLTWADSVLVPAIEQIFP